jgi:hypothetical protein
LKPAPTDHTPIFARKSMGDVYVIPAKAGIQEAGRDAGATSERGILPVIKRVPRNAGFYWIPAYGRNDRDFHRPL